MDKKFREVLEKTGHRTLLYKSNQGKESKLGGDFSKETGGNFVGDNLFGQLLMNLRDDKILNN